jgi:hypothetical protein
MHSLPGASAPVFHGNFIMAKEQKSTFAARVLLDHQHMRCNNIVVGSEAEIAALVDAGIADSDPAAITAALEAGGEEVAATLLDTALESPTDESASAEDA